MLQVEGLTVRYGEHTALEDVSFRVHEGEWLMLTGPNGAGKSTALEAIAQGIPYSGTVLLDGADARKMKPAERAGYMGVLAQSNHVPYSFSVEEIARLGRYARSRDDGAVDDALEMTGMSALRARVVNTLSGGEVQRAFLAQLFAQSPRLLLLDEPASHLDVGSSQEIYSLIARWLKSPGRAVLSVVHDLSAALAYGSAALLLQKGKTVACGKPEQALSDQNLNAVYQTDVRAYMRQMLSRWS